MKRVLILFVLIGIFTALPAALAQEDEAAAREPDSQTKTAVQSDVDRFLQRAATADTNLACSDSPFGSVLDLFQEREIFVGYEGATTPTSGYLSGYWLDIAPSTGEFQGLHAVADGNDGRHQISWQTATAADLNGDGKDEFVQTFADANDNYHIAAHRNGSSLDTIQENAPNHSYFSIAAGNLLGEAGEDEEIVVASRSGSGVLIVTIWNGTASGGLGEMAAVWRSNVAGRANATYINAAVGNLDNDQYDDIAIAFLESDGETIQIVVLEYTPGHSQGSGDNVESNLKEIATTTESAPGTPRTILATTARLNDDGRHEIIVAADETLPSTPGLSPNVHVLAFDFKVVDGANVVSQWKQWSAASNSFNLALAAGDVDRNGRDEIAIGHYSAGTDTIIAGLNVRTLQLVDINPTTQELHQRSHYTNNTLFPVAQHLSLDVGGFHNDGIAAITAAFSNGNDKLALAAFIDQGMASGGLLLQDTHTTNIALNDDISVVTGDWDNNSLKAYAEGKCAKVFDQRITGVVYVPPFWQNIQGGLPNINGAIGRSVTSSGSTATSLTYERGHTVSGYVGASAGGEILGIGVGAAAKATAAEEYSRSNLRQTTSMTATTYYEGDVFAGDSLLYETTEYNCYSYAVKKNGQPLDDITTRFCELIPLDENTATAIRADSLDGWDVNFSHPLPITQTEWAPVTRPWSSLAFFRDAYAVQSSDYQTATAALAIDGNTSGDYYAGSVSHTQRQDNPWWQIDLGSSQAVGKIRLWNRTNQSCADGPCLLRLSNFYVFISDTDPRDISNDPAVLKNDPRVHSYTLADVSEALAVADAAGEVTTLVTSKEHPTAPGQLQYASGRYVRVQIAAADAVLSLAEVQIFGPNHVDPDRYPIDVRDADSTLVWNSVTDRYDYQPGTDNQFEVLLFNPLTQSEEWVTVPGNLLWESNNTSRIIGRGNTPAAEWSYSLATVTETLKASAIGHQARIGAEFDVEAGIGVQMQVGYGEEFSEGFTRETAQITSWESSFEMGGMMQNFPASYNGQANNWVTHCEYRFRPYYYEVVEKSSSGEPHRFTVLDYVVPAGDDNNQDLDRTKDLEPCRRGNNERTYGIYLPLVRRP